MGSWMLERLFGYVVISHAIEERCKLSVEFAKFNIFLTLINAFSSVLCGVFGDAKGHIPSILRFSSAVIYGLAYLGLMFFRTNYTFVFVCLMAYKATTPHLFFGILKTLKARICDHEIIHNPDGSVDESKSKDIQESTFRKISVSADIFAFIFASLLYFGIVQYLTAVGNVQGDRALTVFSHVDMAVSLTFGAFTFIIVSLTLRDVAQIVRKTNAAHAQASLDSFSSNADISAVESPSISSDLKAALLPQSNPRPSDPQPVSLVARRTHQKTEVIDDDKNHAVSDTKKTDNATSISPLVTSPLVTAPEPPCRTSCLSEVLSAIRADAKLPVFVSLYLLTQLAVDLMLQSINPGIADRAENDTYAAVFNAVSGNGLFTPPSPSFESSEFVFGNPTTVDFTIENNLCNGCFLNHFTQWMWISASQVAVSAVLFFGLLDVRPRKMLLWVHPLCCLPLLAVCLLASPSVASWVGANLSITTLCSVVPNLMQVGSIIVPFYRVSSFAATPANVFGAVSASMSVANQLLVSFASWVAVLRPRFPTPNFDAMLCAIVLVVSVLIALLSGWRLFPSTSQSDADQQVDPIAEDKHKEDVCSTPVTVDESDSSATDSPLLDRNNKAVSVV